MLYTGERSTEVRQGRQLQSDIFECEVSPGQDYFLTFTLNTAGNLLLV